MSQTPIPYLFMRGGTSRGPYFNRADLPQDTDQLAKVLVSALGSGHPLNIDGIGGGNAVTTKVAMLSKSTDPWADIDYFLRKSALKMVWLISSPPAAISFLVWRQRRLKWVCIQPRRVKPHYAFER